MVYNTGNGGTELIIDVTGVTLIPGNQGKDCPGNGTNPAIECCCDECDYMLCCCAVDLGQCNLCKEYKCPRVGSSGGMIAYQEDFSKE